MTAKPKTDPGHCFEDFTLGETLIHATPRTITEGDISLYTGLTGSRFAPQSAAPFAKSVGLFCRTASGRRTGLPHGLRYDGPGHFSQCCGQSWLCRRPVPEAALCPGQR